ncbi:hypothetical protein CN563_13370 [Bacillus sp. AFS026049]|nr:hypothetical protein CN563_13370 [Bacillus sp. AFS026049]
MVSATSRLLITSLFISLEMLFKISDPINGCISMIFHSYGDNGPGFYKIPSGISAFPILCTTLEWTI